ncbi:MAG: DUF2945 domain-containing protein [Candidatus Saccharibacteria bacterium]
MKVKDTVAWTWGSGIAEGVVLKICPERTEIISKGKVIVRNGTPDNPALIIKHKSGNKVIKLQNEVQTTNQE